MAHTSPESVSSLRLTSSPETSTESAPSSTTDSSQKPTFAFINTNTTDPDVKVLNRKLVRSRAMQLVRKRAKIQKLEARGAEREPDESMRQRILPTRLKVSRQECYLLSKSSSQINTTELHTFDGHAISSAHLSKRPSQWKPGFIESDDLDEADQLDNVSLIRQLISGRKDPFVVWPAGSGDFVDELMFYGLSYQWGPVLSSSEWQQSMWDGAQRSPLISHTSMFAALAHRDILRRLRGGDLGTAVIASSSDDRVRLLHHKQHTIRLINKSLNAISEEEDLVVVGHVLDQLIMGVMALASHEFDRIPRMMIENSTSPFKPPLQDAGWLSTYAAIRHSPTHWKACSMLIERRGGLEHIEVPGVGHTLQFCDGNEACLNERKPSHPLMRYNVKVLAEFDAFHPILLSTTSLASGFENPFISSMASIALMQVIRRQAAISHIFATLDQGSPHSLTMTRVVEYRNLTHYTMVDLDTATDLFAKQEIVGDLYECLRLAVVVYGVGVTYPFPPISGVLRRETRKLYEQLITFNIFERFRGLKKFLLWILVVAGIASEGTQWRSWFVRQLAQTCDDIGLWSWEDARIIVHEFLWLTSACEVGAKRLWDDLIVFRLGDPEDGSAMSTTV